MRIPPDCTDCTTPAAKTQGTIQKEKTVAERRKICYTGTNEQEPGGYHGERKARPHQRAGQKSQAGAPDPGGNGRTAATAAGIYCRVPPEPAKPVGQYLRAAPGWHRCSAEKEAEITENLPPFQRRGRFCLFLPDNRYLSALRAGRHRGILYTNMTK